MAHRGRPSLLARLERSLTSVFGTAQLGDPREPPVQRPGEPVAPWEWDRKGPPGARYLVRREQPPAPAVEPPAPRLIPHDEVTRPALPQRGEVDPPR